MHVRGQHLMTVLQCHTRMSPWTCLVLVGHRQYITLWKVTKGLWRTFPIQGTSVQIAQVLFNRPRTSGRRTSCGKTFNLKTDDNVERVRSLVRSDRRLTLKMICSELNLNRFTVHQILTQDLDMRKCAPRWFQRTSRLSRRPIGGMCVLIFWTTLRGRQNSSVALSRVMNHGFWSTTPRQNAKVGSGTLQNLPVPRKREWANPKSNRCSFVFWQSEDRPQGICATRTNYQSKFLSASPWDPGKGWHMCDQPLHALGCCITTTLRVTRKSP